MCHAMVTVGFVYMLSGVIMFGEVQEAISVHTHRLKCIPVQFVLVFISHSSSAVCAGLKSVCECVSPSLTLHLRY